MLREREHAALQQAEEQLQVCPAAQTATLDLLPHLTGVLHVRFGAVRFGSVCCGALRCMCVHLRMLARACVCAYTCMCVQMLARADTCACACVWAQMRVLEDACVQMRVLAHVRAYAWSVFLCMCARVRWCVLARAHVRVRMSACAYARPCACVCVRTRVCAYA